VTFSVTATVGLPAAASASASASTGSGAGAVSTGVPAADPSSGVAAAEASVTGTWTYTSTLISSRVTGAQNWVVLWQPTILGANLTSTTHLATVAVALGAGIVTDDAGGNLANSADPGLQKIAGLLATIAYTLAQANINIVSAKINTLGERAEDAFLIDGARLHDEHALLRLETALYEQLRP